MLVSIIIPCYNAATKITRCLRSLEGLEQVRSDVEFIFVDDASTDDTVEIIQRTAGKRKHWRIIQLQDNSGSPSRPRNLGVQCARGKYVFFLDADDEIVPESFNEQCDKAFQGDLCLVRSALIVKQTGHKPKITNRITGFIFEEPIESQIAKIIAQQSTTCSSLIKTDLLLSNAVTWPEHLHMGEDTVFLIDVMSYSKRIGYVDTPGIIYNKVVSSTKTATQRYGARELASHLEVWAYAEDTLRTHGLSYFSVRGQVALKEVVTAMYRFYSGDIGREEFNEFSAFLKKHRKVLSEMVFTPRIKQTLQLIQDGDYEAFIQDIKPRLVIAGGDLKFIEGSISALSVTYQVRVDHWDGHDRHDPGESGELLEWADIIWCEWLLGNAVWYADRKRWDQKLIVRLHLFELTRDFGARINQDKVDAFVAVSVPTAEDMMQTFRFDRSKVRVIPNFIEVDSYRQSTSEDRVFRLGIVGILPRRKGYMQALRLLKALRVVDRRYELDVFGKMPEELLWVHRDEQEREYFDECAAFIRRNELESFVHVRGWVDTRSDLADVGFVLSMSDFESFHVAPAESFASGNQAVFLPWSGVDFIYPREYVFESVYAMRDYILDQRQPGSFVDSAERGQSHVRELYSLERFVHNVRELIVEL